MRISLEERRRGEFIHKVLSYVEYAEDGYQEGLLKSIVSVKNESGTDYPEQEIKEAVIGLIEHEELNAYFRQKSGRAVRREQEFSDGEGRLFRMDRVIIDGDRITVVDYKTGGEKEDEEKYRLQMKTYMKILKEVYPEKEIAGIIAYVDRKEVRRIY